MNGTVYVYKTIRTTIKGCDVPHRGVLLRKSFAVKPYLVQQFYSGLLNDCIVR